MAPPTKRPSRSGTSVNNTRLNDVVQRYLLDDYDKLLIRERIKHSEISLKDLGDKVGLSTSAVSERMDRPAFKIAFEEYSVPLDKIFSHSVDKAYRTMLALMDDEDKDMRFRAANAILQRFAGPQTVVQNNFGKGEDTPGKTKVKVYRTTVEPDGSLLGQVMELELGPGETPIEPLTYNVPTEGDNNG